MTEKEKEVLEALGKAAFLFRRLEIQHAADLGEFVAAIHMAQNIVLARAGMREMHAAGMISIQPIKPVHP